MGIKGPNLSKAPLLVPGVVVQGRTYPAGVMGARNPPHAYHSARLTGDSK